MKKMTLLCLAFFVFLNVQAIAQESPTDIILSFLKNNPNKMSLSYSVNGKEYIHYSDDLLVTVGQLSNMVIAVEYARQAAAGKIQPEKPVKISDINVYNLNTNRFNVWTDYLTYTKKLRGGSIRLKDVAAGMISFSSESCADYLIDLLGMENINDNLQKLKLYQHTQIFPIGAADMLCSNPYNSPPELYIDSLYKLSQTDFIDATIKLRETLKKDTVLLNQINYESEHKHEYLSLLSDKAPKSSTQEYVSLAEKINSRNYFSKAEQDHLNYVMEAIPMTSPITSKHFQYCGFMTSANIDMVMAVLYGTDKKGNKVQLACVFSDLSRSEHIDIATNINHFIFDIAENFDHMRKFKSELNNIIRN
ncbi:serine hydrolase [Limibacter armeniacum]|uniref:serine hydrolase n=1 Tax=Limibacter armeniacum TaxID=466084 RepID=UPI002FE5A81E